MRAVGRNLLIAAILFALFVGLDYIYVHHNTPAVEVLVLVPLGFLTYILIPAAFWWANRSAFATSPQRVLMRLGLVVVLSIAFYAISAIPFLLIHFAIGGRH